LAARRYPRFRPFTLLLSRASLLPPDARSGVQKGLFKAVYATMNLLMRRADVGFLNYGYSPLEDAGDLSEFSPEADPDRFSIQLYDKVAGAVDLRGLDVLEVGCGRGGGAAFVFERHGPRSLTGVDLSASSVAYCQRSYARPGLSFRVADAEHLPFPDGSFDAVLNVESSHCYPNVEGFFLEVARVLRPGGVFVAADSIGSDQLRQFHHDDIYQPVDPGGLADRLERAGLVDVAVNVYKDQGWNAIGRKPAAV
jgi:SAM-dependent methyltransferase